MADEVVKKSTLFFGWTLHELEQLRTKIKRDMITHGIDYVQSYSLGGKSVNKAERMRLKQVMAEIKTALQELDPDTYGLNSRTTTGGFGNLSL